MSILDSSQNLIGGISQAMRNVISGNSHGVVISGSDSTDNNVQGNFIGTDVAGMTAIPNGFSGVRIESASNNLIGGTKEGAGNLISGNSEHGVFILKSVAPDSVPPNGNVVQGNLIGTDVTGDCVLVDEACPLGNSTSGVRIENGTDNFIGRVATVNGIVEYSGAGNIIAFNGFDGISIKESSAGNSILSNSIFSNGDIGIDLADDGESSNDTGDADPGPNNIQNTPVISSAQIDAFSELFIEYEVDSGISNSAYPLLVEFFKVDVEAADINDPDVEIDDLEGKIFLGSDIYESSDAPGTEDCQPGNCGCRPGEGRRPDYSHDYR